MTDIKKDFLLPSLLKEKLKIVLGKLINIFKSTYDILKFLGLTTELNISQLAASPPKLD